MPPRPPPGGVEGQPAEVDAYFEKLAGAVKTQSHKKILKITDDILRIAPTDEDALRCKITALMQLSEFDEALKLIAKPAIAASFGFEKAYCLYRLGRIEEGLKAVHEVDAASSQARALVELEAQLQYRLGNNKECIQLYEQLFQAHKADSTELKSNVLAAYVAANLSHQIPQLMASMKLAAKASIEVGFNKVCGLIDSGEFAAAENELRLAQKHGREALFEEDLTEDEVQDELAPLTVQLAFLLGRLGRSQEAQEAYDIILRGSGEPVGDLATRAVATNNLVADARRAEGTARKSIASSIKKLEAFQDRSGGVLRLASGLETRLSASQRRVLHLNRALLYLAAGRTDEAREVATALAKDPSGACNGWDQLALLQAAVAVRDGKVAEADKQLAAFAAAHPAAARRPNLMRAQLALEAGQAANALTLLASAAVADPQLAASGALLATRVALLEQLNDVAGAEALLDSSLAFWKERSKEPAAPVAITWCLQALLTIKVKLNKLQEAANLFSQLRTTGSQSSTASEAFARLARAVAASDASAVPALAKELGSAPDTRGMDIERLEDLARGGVLAPGTAAAAATSAATTSGRKLDTYAGRKRDVDPMDVDAQPKAKKPRKKRKPRLPAGFDPTKGPNGGLPLPDPQRWLAKWQRSDFKKKSRQRRDGKHAVKGSQGAGKVDDNLDRASAAAEAKADAAKAKGLPALKAPAGAKGKKGKK